jgi:PAS domain S-box-containing protein
MSIVNFPSGASEMAGRIRTFPWADTPLGPVETWPDALRTLVGVMLESYRPMFLTWGSRRTLLYNDRFTMLLGALHPDALGRALPEAWPELLQAVGPLLAQASAGQLAHAEEVPVYLRRFGTRVRSRFAVSCAPVRLEDGHVGGIIGMCEEPADPSRAARAQRESAARFRAVFETSGVGMAQVDATGRLVEVNQRLCEMLGYRSSELVGRMPGDLAHPEDREADETGMEALLRGESVEHHVELRMLHRDGAIVRVAKHARPVRDEQGCVASAVILLEDITARHATESALAEGEARFRALVEGLAQAVWETDAEGVVVTDSPSWRAYTGQRLEEWLGYGWVNAIHPDDRAYAEAQWRDAVSRGATVNAEFRLRRAEGGWRWTNVIAAPIRGPDGAIRKWVGMNVDISARHAAEEGLREADRRKDEFLATLAHELRNPLAPIRHGLELLRLAEGNTELLARTRVMMGRQVDMLVRLVDDLLELSRIARGKIELRRERVLLADVVRAAVESSLPQIEGARHRLAVSVPIEPLMVDGDPVRLAQVLANLLNNAARYTPTGGDISLHARRSADGVAIAVRDNGIGIPPEMLPCVFDLFTQVEGAATREQGGLGLGLALVQRMVSLHGGRVEARSDGAGTGSEFLVHLPVAGDAPSAVPPASEHGAGFAVQRVLVVDDNHDAADSLGALLQHLGLGVRVAYDGTAALEALGEFEPDLVLLDLGMPGMDGYATAQRMRERPAGRDAMIVALTGWGQERDRRRVLAAAFDRHLLKPVALETLHELLLARRAPAHAPGEEREG